MMTRHQGARGVSARWFATSQRVKARGGGVLSCDGEASVASWAPTPRCRAPVAPVPGSVRHTSREDAWFRVVFARRSVAPREFPGGATRTRRASGGGASGVERRRDEDASGVERRRDEDASGVGRRRDEDASAPRGTDRGAKAPGFRGERRVERRRPAVPDDARRTDARPPDDRRVARQNPGAFAPRSVPRDADASRRASARRPPRPRRASARRPPRPRRAAWKLPRGDAPTRENDAKPGILTTCVPNGAWNGGEGAQKRGVGARSTSRVIANARSVW